MAAQTGLVSQNLLGYDSGAYVAQTESRSHGIELEKPLPCGLEVKKISTIGFSKFRAMNLSYTSWERVGPHFAKWESNLHTKVALLAAMTILRARIWGFFERQIWREAADEKETEVLHGEGRE